jgi:hypothetical protein
MPLMARKAFLAIAALIDVARHARNRPVPERLRLTISFFPVTLSQCCKLWRATAPPAAYAGRTATTN